MIDRDLCQPRFHEFHSWPCPACGRGSLIFDHKHVRRWPSKGIVWAVEEGYMMRGDENGVFSTLLKCSNYTCNQGIAVLGDYSSDIIDASYNTETSYTIRDVYPPIALINIPAGATEPIKRALQRSFGLYWRDPQSCATTLRTAIEGIADAVGHPARQNGRFVNLGTRLKRMKATHPELVGAAEAIKDVGNVGAHGDAVDQTKLLVALELLEIELRQLFNDDPARRQELVKELKT